MEDRFDNFGTQFDSFGLESPFAESAFARDTSALEVGGEANEQEDLAWLDTESAWGKTGDELLEAEATDSPSSAKQLEGGLVWTVRDSEFGAPVTYFLSPAAHKERALEVLVYIHGLLDVCGWPSGGMEGLIASRAFGLAKHVAKSGRPILLVAPQLQARPGKGTWSAHGLQQPNRLGRLVSAAIAETAKRTRQADRMARSIILAGHSRAYGVFYPTLRALAKDPRSLQTIGPLSAIWMLDANYPRWGGGWPAEAIATLHASVPELSVTVAYRTGTATDLFKGREGGVAPTLVALPRSISHCALPGHVMPRLLGRMSAPVMPGNQASEGADLFYEDEFEDFAAEEEFPLAESFAEDLEDGFATESEFNDLRDEFEEFDDNESEWGDEASPSEFLESESEGEVEEHCSHDEAEFEGIDAFLESETWSASPEQIAFRESVLAAHIKRTEARKRRAAQPDLTSDQLATVPGTKIKTRKDTAQAAGVLLAAVNAALVAAQQTGDADALNIRKISVTSGYRSGARQLDLWRKVFSAKGGYYDQTEAVREKFPGGPHSKAAVAYLLKSKSQGGFGIGGRIAAPGFSNHQDGTALDFLVTLQNGKSIKLSSQDRYRAIWQRSWFHKWMIAHAAEHGFQPIATEEWHWEYRPAASSRTSNFSAESESYADETNPFAEHEEPVNPSLLGVEGDEGETTLQLLNESGRYAAQDSVLFADELPPEPFRIRGGLYSVSEKNKAASQSAGFILTSSVIGSQEEKLARLAPPTIVIGKELALWEDRKLGVWVSKYNRFVYYYCEVLRGIGRLRDLLSAGAPEAPTDLTAPQKRALRPTDDRYPSKEKKDAFTLWRSTEKSYRSSMASVAQALYELEMQRREFWAKRGLLLASIAAAKQLTKPELDGLDIELSDIVSLATAGSVPAAFVTGLAMLADAVLNANKKQKEYDAKMKAFKARIRITNQEIQNKLAEVDIAGTEFWTKRKALLAAITLRNETRMKGRENGALFGQVLSKSVSSNRALAEIRMPILVAGAWWGLGFAGLRAKRLATDNLSYLRTNSAVFDKAVIVFDKQKANSTAYEDVRRISRAANDLKDARRILSDDEVAEWLAINNLWNEFFVNFYR